MPLPDLTEDEKAELIDLLRVTVSTDRYPLSPRIKLLKSVLAKLDPKPARTVEPFPPPKPPAQPSMVLSKKKRRPR
jgi:hypothetical protein